jgi:hypothetical protein
MFNATESYVVKMCDVCSNYHLGHSTLHDIYRLEDSVRFNANVWYARMNNNLMYLRVDIFMCMMAMSS